MTGPGILIEELTAVGCRAAQVSSDWEYLTGTLYETLGARIVVGPEQLYGLVDSFSETAATLHVQMMTLDREAGDLGLESIGELALRAVTLVILLLLHQLTGALGEPGADAERLFSGRLRTVDDVAAFVLLGLRRTNRVWQRYRCAAANMEHRRALARCAARNARRVLSAIGRDPDFAHLLHRGAARVDWPAVHGACTRISALLEAIDPAGPAAKLACVRRAR